MDKTRTVVLYGNSLVVSSIAASLKAQPHLLLCQPDTSAPDLAQQLRSLAPDVLVFDLASAHPDFAITLLKEHPRMLLIGVDIVNAGMLVLSGQQTQALTIDDLTRVIETYPNTTPESATRSQPNSQGD